MELQLIVELARNQLESDRATFSDSYSLTSNLFEIQDTENAVKPRLIWLTIWESWLLEIFVLIVSLIVLTVIILEKHALARNARLFHCVRWIFLFSTLLFIGSYAKGQLSVVNIFTVLLQQFRGFDIGIRLLDPAIFIRWIYTVVSHILWGPGCILRLAVPVQRFSGNGRMGRKNCISSSSMFHSACTIDWRR